MAWYYIVLLAAYCGTIVSLIVVILSENRNPVKTLAWMTVLLLVPVFGVVLYIFFGRSLKNTRMITRRNRRRLRKREQFLRGVNLQREGLSVEGLQQVKLASTLTGAIYYPANRVEIFTNGRDKFESLLRDIADAHHYIHLQYYIIADDDIGTRVADALIAKAREGVRVKVVYDHIGSLKTKSAFFRRMTDAGIEVYPFFRVTFPHFATRVNWRNHRKLVVIDGHISYVGGMNVADRYIHGVSSGVWRDTHLRITGPATGGVQYAFAVDWSFMGQPLVEAPVDRHMRRHAMFNAGIQILTAGPTNLWSNIAMVLQKAISNAKRRVFIQTPYFLPNVAMLRTLQAAALSKVDVRVMLPARSDSALLTFASFSYVKECLEAGIKVYLYEAGMLHAKTVIVDDEFASVGSTNFDFRSFEHNFEINAFVYSTDVNSRLREIFMKDINECVRIDPTLWVKRPVMQKVKESVFRLLSPIL